MSNETARPFYPQCVFCTGCHGPNDYLACRNNLLHILSATRNELSAANEFIEGMKKDLQGIFVDTLDPLDSDEHNTPPRPDGAPDLHRVAGDIATSRNITPQRWGGFAEVPCEATGGRAFFIIEDKNEEGND